MRFCEILEVFSSLHLHHAGLKDFIRTVEEHSILAS